jgi:hypothetical protein
MVRYPGIALARAACRVPCTAHCPASVAGCLPYLPGLGAVCGSRGVFTASGTKKDSPCSGRSGRSVLLPNKRQTPFAVTMRRGQRHAPHGNSLGTSRTTRTGHAPPVSSHAGPDHQRVRELYADLSRESDGTDDPLEQARLEVLHNILEPYLATAQQALPGEPSIIVYDVKAALGALVLPLCHLDEHDYDSAAEGLDAAIHSLQDAQDLLRAFRDGIAYA